VVFSKSKKRTVVLVNDVVVLVSVAVVDVLVVTVAVVVVTVVMVVVGQSPSPGKQSVASSHARPFLFCSVTTSQFRSVATWQAEVHGSIRISQLTSPGS
jgi:hypothetical protein